MTKREKADLAKAFDLLKSEEAGAWDAGARIINRLIGRSNAMRDLIDAAPTIEFGEAKENDRFGGGER